MLYLMKLLTIVTGVLLSFSVLGEIYQWKDENGKVHFSDKKPATEESVENQVKTITVNEGNSFRLPEVEQLQPIPYTAYEKPLAFSLSTTELNLENANYQRVKIGQMLSGNNCENMQKKIYWRDGNGYFNSNNINSAIITSVNKAGYNLNLPGIYDEASVRLVLKAELQNIVINSCLKPKDKISRNEGYIQVKWELYDKLLRKSVYSGTSEGNSINSSYSDVFKTGAQAINAAFTIATNNLLADHGFVKHINSTKAPNPIFTSFDPIAIEMRHVIGISSFRQQLPSLQDSTVTVRNTEGHGSGVVVSGDGHVLTNAHVIGKDNELIVIYKNREYRAKVVRQDPIRDIALLKIDGPVEFSISFISQTKPLVGDRLFAIGSPLSESLSHSVTSGILSAYRTMDGLNFYQTDTSINPGNSGGPTYNETGELVAISVSGIFSAGGAGIGINYLIPIDDAFAALSIKPGSEVQAFEQATARQQDSVVKRKSDSSYSNYQQALVAKENSNFDYAEELLLKAVSSIDHKDASKAAYVVRDELYFHLPIAKAKRLINDQKPMQARISIQNVNQYLTDNPKRFEYLAQINQIKDAIENLALVMNAQSKSNLVPVRIFIQEHYADRGELPGSVAAMSKLLNDKLGHQFSNQFHLVDYTLVNRKYIFVFEDLNNFERHEFTVAVY